MEERKKRLQYEITEIKSNVRADVVPQWVQVVIDKLCAISPDIDRQGLMTWQYCVKARKGELQ